MCKANIFLSLCWKGLCFEDDPGLPVSAAVSCVCGLLGSPRIPQDQVTQGACLGGPPSSFHPKAVSPSLSSL